MPAPPLTHHDILGLVEPFTRRGRAVDLAATDRLERRLVFKAIDHPAAAPGAAAMREVLQLESFAAGICRLTRTLTLGSGLQATLQVQGVHAGELLAQVEGFPLQRHFRAGAGYSIARSYELRPPPPRHRGPGAEPLIVLSRGVVHIDGLSLTMTPSPVRGVAADLLLEPTGGDSFEFPEDLLAVLGWNWARLIAQPRGWKSKLRLIGNVGQKTLAAELGLERAAGQLVQTLAEAPARFHERYLTARRVVVFRRAIPLLTPLCLLSLIAFMPRFDFAPGPGPWLVLYHVPTALIALSFCVQELPQFEIPPWPRRSQAPNWRLPARTPSAGTSAGTEAPTR